MGAEIDAELRRKLIAAAGEGSVAGGVALPASRAAVAAMVAACAEAGRTMTIRSGPGPAPDGRGLPISLERLTKITVDVPNLVVRAEAGATVAELRASVEREAQALVGLPGSTEAQHVGALIARGEVPRRALTGVDIVLSTGDVVVSGGRVLKDVAGYDLPAAILGSMGRLAVIVAATFRLQPARARMPAAAAAGARSTAEDALVAAFDPGSLLH